MEKSRGTGREGRGRGKSREREVAGKRRRIAGRGDSGEKAVRVWSETEAGHLLGTFDANHPWLMGLPKGEIEADRQIRKPRSRGKFRRSPRHRASLSLIIMTSFETNWKPALNGNRLQPCILIAELVDDDIKPDPRNVLERPWSVAGLREFVGYVPEAKWAIVESVLAIWRLKQREEEGGKVEDADADAWQDHLEAWLVRGGFGFTGGFDLY